MDVEGGLISSVVLNQHLNMALERRVTSEFFTDDQHRRVWDYITKHYLSYGSQPDADVVLQAYPSYELTKPSQTTEYFIEECAKRRRLAILMNGIQDSVSISVKDEEPDKAAQIHRVLSDAIVQASVETTPTLTLTYPTLVRRLAEEWRSNPVGPGISYGFPTLDSVTNGMRPEQFVVFTGLPKTRKSWTLLYTASSVQLQDYPSAFITFEMSNAEQGERLATLWGNIPYRLMKDTDRITDDQIRSLRKMVRVREQLRDFYGVEDTYGHSTVSSLLGLVKDTEIAVLFIDGIYLMTDERTGQAGFEGNGPLTNISRDLKRLAKSAKIAVVVTTQTLISKTRGGKTNLHGMGYTSAFSQDADVVVGVESSEESHGVTTMRVLGNRTGPQGVVFDVLWDFNTGAVDEVDMRDPVALGGAVADDEEEDTRYGYGDIS